MMKIYFHVVFVANYFCIFINGQALQHAKKLHSALLSGYMKDVFPRDNQSEPLNIDIGCILFSVNSFQEVEERISVTAGIDLIWKDISLTWNPTSYGGKEHIFIPSKLIWTPFVVLLNTPGELKTVGENSEYIASVTCNGSVNYTPGDVMVATCPVDVSKFPYDVQICTLEFVPWGYLSWAIKFTSQTDSVYTFYYTENSDWKITQHSTSVELVGIGIYSFKVKITIKREPTYYMVTIIIPTLLFCLLNPLVFLIPVDSGDRISLAMTILLSYAIFLTLVSSSIPATSNPMCFLLLILIIIIIISGLIVVFAIITLKYHHDDKFKLGKCSMVLIRLTGQQKIVPADNRLSGKEFSRSLDRLFLVISYILLFIVILSYVIFVNN